MSLRSSIVFFIFCSTIPAWSGTVSLSVEGAAELALKRNPALAAARLRIEEARGRHQQSGRPGNPEMELDFTRNTTGPEGSVGISLMQRFPLTARLRHEKAVTQAELAAAGAEIRDAERQLAAEVRTAAVKLLALTGQRELRTRQLGNSRELASFLQKRVAAAEASQVDVAQVELESRQIEVEMLMLAAEETSLAGELRPLLGLAAGDQLHITGKLPAPGNFPAASPVTGRPDILAAQSRAEAARSTVLEQRARRWEDIGVGVSLTRDRTLDEPEPVETEHTLGFRVSLPLPIWNNNSGRIREAQAAAVRAEMEAGAAVTTANAGVASALDALRACARLINELDNQVLPAAARIEEMLPSSYSSGETPLTDVLRARTQRLELERQRLDALRDYQLARIRHSAAADSSNPTPKTHQ